MNISKELEAFVDQFVRVSICEDNFTRNNFDSQLSVAGTLEKHPGKNCYRVVVNDDTYTYFTLENVVGCMPKEIDGVFPTENTIFLKIAADTKHTKIKDVEYSYERVLRVLEPGHRKLIPMLRKKWEGLLWYRHADNN